MRIATPTLIAAGLLAAGTAAAAVLAPAPRSSGKDYTSIPPDPAAVVARASGTAVTITRAVEIAEEAVGGKVTSIALDLASETPRYEVVAFSETVKHALSIDAAEGTVLSDEEVPRFPGVAPVGDWTETDTGLKYWDIRAGEGESPVSEATQVKVHYTGWLVDGTKFDSSHDRGEPITFTLSGVIPGWTQGLLTMKEGGMRKLVIPPALGYRARGFPPVIPPQATLIFDVELIEIVR